MPSEDNRTDILTDRAICIIGPHKLQNLLLVHFLGNKTGATLQEGENFHEFLTPANRSDLFPKLFLCDCLGKHLDSFLDDFGSFDARTLAAHYIALFNVNLDSDGAQRALDIGVRGFFYEQDTLEQLLKGIRAIFSNELWISRDILTKRILEKRGPNGKTRDSGVFLTTREIEILSLMAAGITNDEIADKLCISRHTVRTHAYNTFKKINVPNRLQAALWAVKNL